MTDTEIVDFLLAETQRWANNFGMTGRVIDTHVGGDNFTLTLHGNEPINRELLIRFIEQRQIASVKKKVLK